MTSVLSILHRITGAGLALGALLVAGWLLAAHLGDGAFALAIQFKKSVLGRLMLLGWLFAFIYHFFNGIRHLKWDAGFGLTLKNVYLTGYIVIAASAVLTAAIWISAGSAP